MTKQRAERLEMDAANVLRELLLLVDRVPVPEQQEDSEQPILM